MSEAPGDTVGGRAHVAAQLADDAELARIAPLLNAVLLIDLPENDLTAQMTGQVRAANTLSLLLNLLQRAAAQTPLLLVIEDAHWLDSNSWALVAAAAQQVSPLLLVLATRPVGDMPPPELGTLLQSSRTVAVELGPLEAATRCPWCANGWESTVCRRR